MSKKFVLFVTVKSRKKVVFFGANNVRYHSFGHQFSFKNQVSLDEIWHLYLYFVRSTKYSSGKQTYSQLAAQFCCSTKTIQRRLDQAPIIRRNEKPKTAEEWFLKGIALHGQFNYEKAMTMYDKV